MGDVYAMSIFIAVISASAVDEGRVTKHDKSKVVDRNVIIRQRKKARLENPKVIHIDSLYFDGKENKTMMRSGKFEKQDHIAMLSESGQIFIAHVVASSKNAEDSEAAIIKGLEGVHVSNLRVLAGDGTPSNTGHLRGTIARIYFYISIFIIIYQDFIYFFINIWIISISILKNIIFCILSIYLSSSSQ